jgi:hypothetical protein
MTKTTLTLQIYDPNHSGETRTIELSKDPTGNYVLTPTGAYGDMVTEYGITNIGAGQYPNVDWNAIADHVSALVQKVYDNLPSTSGSFLGIKLACPVNLLVEASNGSRIGYDSTSGQILNELSGVYYSGTNDDPKIAIIPNPTDDPYKLKLSGTATGNYTLTAERYVEGQLTGNPISTVGEIANNVHKEYTLQTAGNAQPTIAETKTGTTDYIPYIILAAAIVLAGVAIGVGVSRRRR